MFTLDNYKVSFQHTQFPVGTWCHGTTNCIINDLQDDNNSRIGTAICSRQDQFNRAVGRKVALTRALKPFDKETRTRFWKRYFEVLGGVK